MFYLISFRYVLNILKILTIYYFTQNHIYISYIIIKFVDYLIRKTGWRKFLGIILFVFQLFGLLIYIEIIELNFLNLNKNTKKNVEKREKEEDERLLSDENSRISEIEENGKKMNKVEISPGYIVASEMVTISRDSDIEENKNDENSECNEKNDKNNIASIY